MESVVELTADKEENMEGNIALTRGKENVYNDSYKNTGGFKRRNIAGSPSPGRLKMSSTSSSKRSSILNPSSGSLSQEGTSPKSHSEVSAERALITTLSKVSGVSL